MKATHIHYKHPYHLRVVDGRKHLRWDFIRGWQEVDGLCVSPSCSDYAQLKRPGLPQWKVGDPL